VLVTASDVAPVWLVVFSKREGVSAGYLLWMWAAVIDDRWWSSLALVTTGDVAAASCMVGGIQQARVRGDMHGVLTSAVGSSD